jgi:SAM-dependent methyltransferase
MSNNNELTKMSASGVHDKVLELCMPYIRNKKILVAGSGEGGFEHLLLNSGVNSELITSVDVNPRQFKIDGQHCSFCDLNREMEFADGSFDTCIAIEVIEHLHDPQNLIIEACRVLKKDGLLFVTTPNVHSIAQKLRFLFSDNFLWFRDRDHDNLGHLHPIFDWLLQWMIKDKFELDAYDAPRFSFKLLAKGPGIPLPIKSRLFADINIYVLRKL